MSGIIVAMAPTRAEALREARRLSIERPHLMPLAVRDGGARWGSKGGRWVVVAHEVAR